MARVGALKGEGLVEPSRLKIRRVRGEQAVARWDRALAGAPGVVVVAEPVAAARGGALGVWVPADDEPQPAIRAAASRAVAACLTAP